MNLYVLVEGRRTEKKVYRAWLGYVFPHLQEVERIEDIRQNNFYLLAGHGYPSYKQRIVEAFENINRQNNIDHFFVCVDTEEESIAEKKAEIEAVIPKEQDFRNCHIILQHCCIETWFLGHRKMLKRNPDTEALRKCKNFYDVSKADPENMECLPGYTYRAHFHLDYLKAMLHERGLSYTKTRPGVVLEQSYFEALIERTTSMDHIRTFGKLIELWAALGGKISA